MYENDLLSYLNIGLPEDVLRMKLHGDFDGAVRLIDRKLSDPALPDPLRYCLMAEREMILRMPSDYPFTREDALKKIRSRIPEFTEKEFDHCLSIGQIRWIYVNGIRIRASVKVKDSAFTPGMFVRVHLPIPAACDQQSDIRIESVFPENAKIAPEDAPQRTVCWEETLKENHEFSVQYSYVHTAVWHDTESALKKSDACKTVGTEVNPGTVSQEQTLSAGLNHKAAETVQLYAHSSNESSSSSLREFEVGVSDDLAELAPHIVFTPYIRALAAELSKGCETPLEKARNFYDFITLNFKYTYMPAYFSLEDIPGNCARTFTGDCGVFALLFITLCRCAGIPAQWQSGLAAEPDFIGGHDWVRFYAAPLGWIYADPSYGIGAVRAENEERRRFYFGNLDPYRMVANRAFQAPFTVEKKYWRTDPYDNQLGEIETAERGLRYEEFERRKDVLMCEEIEEN